MFITASFLVASFFGEDNWDEGYCWFRSQLKGNHENLSSQIKIEKAVKHFKRNEFDSFINPLKSFDMKEAEVRAIAATNLSFLYFLERNSNLSEEYEDIYVRTSQYDFKALVNKCNCLFIKSNFK